MTTFWKIVFLPFTAFYALATYIRNKLYDWNLLKSVSFSTPIISIGNLTYGGTGKTPHTEYLARILKEAYSVAILSRGYGRSTQGFRWVKTTSSSKQVGDEPLQFKWKFPDCLVAVSEDRVFAIPEIIATQGAASVILLDDALQHRAIEPGLSILLTTYHDLFTRDMLLPSGKLREFKSAYHRADIIIVTKSPAFVSEQQKEAIVEEIKPRSYQHVFFSQYTYGERYPIFPEVSFSPDYWGKDTALLITGIADSKPLEAFLSNQVENLYHRSFSDHHNYTRYDIESIVNTWNNISAESKFLITTEKDATRLKEFKELFIEHQIPVFCQPISVTFTPEEEQRFEKAIRFFVQKTLEENFHYGDNEFSQTNR